jgi:hypothetical protein
MIKFFTKIILLTLIISCFTIIVRAQVGYNYAQYDFGFGGQLNQLFGDTKTIKTTPSGDINFTYNQTPFTNFVFDVQAGSLAGGDSVKDKFGRQFSGTFTSFIFRGQLQAGELMDYSKSPFANAMKNFYLSAGIGYLVDHITSINRYSLQIPGFYTPGLQNSNIVFIPIRIGYEFKIYNQYNQPSVRIDLGYEFNYTFSDELDGFVAGKNTDIYSQICIGVKFALGSVTSYRKPIHY